MNRIHIATFGPITLKENGIEYSYASLDKHPDVCPVIDKAGSVASEAATAISLALPMTSFPSIVDHVTVLLQEL